MNLSSRIFLSCITIFCNAQSSITFSTKHINDTTLEVNAQITLKPKEQWLYKEFIKFSVDNPAIQLTPWKSSIDADNKYDSSFKTTKKVFEEDVTFTMQAISSTPIRENSYLHFSYYLNKSASPEEVLFLLPFNKEEDLQRVQHTITASEPPQTPIKQTINQQEKPASSSHGDNFSLSSYISALVQSSQSTSIRLLLVFLLGILLSLTPCIYPMVPITAGILQAQGSKSFLHNFLLSCSYACGMATTFALFGLLASCTGSLCGRLLMEPFFIIGLVILLSYFALSLFGFYEIYVPSFFKTPSSSFKGGSVLSTFIFGAASGTIASPCVSPGLALLLSIVAALGSKILGFLLLFFFGIGLSMPLLIVGTFSSSLNLLPRAGMWMIEIKKLFGFMMFGMCFYYISYIVPSSILSWIIVGFLIVVGIYYLYSAEKVHSSRWKFIHRVVGSLIIIAAFVVCFYSIRSFYAPQELQKDHWHTDYHVAHNEAQQTGKKLFIDFWATFCPVCLAINKTVLTKPAIQNILQNFVLLKVDGTHAANQPYADLATKYPIAGFPTFLIVDPETEKVVAQLGGELYEMKEDAIIELLQKHR